MMSGSNIPWSICFIKKKLRLITTFLFIYADTKKFLFVLMLYHSLRQKYLVFKREVHYRVVR